MKTGATILLAKLQKLKAQKLAKSKNDIIFEKIEELVPVTCPTAPVQQVPEIKLKSKGKKS